MTDFLSGLQAASTCRLDLDSIVNGVSNGLKLIEPWLQASVDHPFLKDFVKGMQKHGAKYREAIDMSIQTAQDGLTFSAAAIDLCDFLLDPDVKPDELREYVLGMQDTAKRARDDSTNTLANFRLVHVGLMEMTKQIPTEMNILKREGGQQKRFVFRLPFFGRVSESTIEPKKRDVKIEAAIAELHEATQGLRKLSESVDGFLAWWVGMETLLSTANSRAFSLNYEKVRESKVVTMRKGWGRINEEYRRYNAKIVQLQDYYPSRVPNSKLL